jgi:hypothetical protein
MKKITNKDICEFEGCNNKATTLVDGRNGRIGKYCDDHADIVLEIGKPEYRTTCGNCGCQIPVN